MFALNRTERRAGRSTQFVDEINPKLSLAAFSVSLKRLTLPMFAKESKAEQFEVVLIVGLRKAKRHLLTPSSRCIRPSTGSVVAELGDWAYPRSPNRRRVIVSVSD